MNPLRSFAGRRAALTVVTAGLLTIPLAAAATTATATTPLRSATGPLTADAGTYLTMVDRGHATRDGGFNATSSTLELVGADGRTRSVVSWPAGARHDYQLTAWSADGATALVDEISGAHSRQQALLVDVADGGVRRVDVGNTSSITLSQDGTRILTTGFGRHGYAMASWTPSGHRTRLDTTTDSGLLPGPDGTLVTGAAHYGHGGLRVLDASTGAVRESVATPGRDCRPVRWWSADRALVSCTALRGSYVSNLALLDPAAGTLTDLTPTHPHGSPDLGDLDARRVPGGLYLQAAGPCGYTFVAQALRHGRVRTVEVPGAVGNVVMVGTAGRDLVVEHEASCDGSAPRSELARLDPASGHEQPIVRLGARQRFETVHAFGETDASLA